MVAQSSCEVNVRQARMCLRASVSLTIPVIEMISTSTLDGTPAKLSETLGALEENVLDVAELLAVEMPVLDRSPVETRLVACVIGLECLVRDNAA